MNPFVTVIVVPAVAGLIALVLPKRIRYVAEILAVAASGWALYAAVEIFRGGSSSYGLPWLGEDELSITFSLVSDPLRSFVLMFAAMFGLLISLYSAEFMSERPGRNRYYGLVLWTVASSAGAILSNNLILFLIFWEFTTLMLFLLTNLGNGDSPRAAAKSFGVLGFSDAALLLGIILFWAESGTLGMGGSPLYVSGGYRTLIFILFLIGALAKAGAMPLHSWIPSMAEPAPTPVMAFLPAAFDKLLGIYFLVVVSLRLFKVGPPMQVVMMVIGAATIVLAVMMALVQHNLKRLLSFHAISQVGYMVLGVGTGNPIGIMGGVFHMLNNSIYKSALFLGAGAVERRTGTSELERLGGLARSMPITFTACLIAALSISGVPPFNGFVSKWMIYQGLIGGKWSLFLLAAAMFGSALTLASFIKVIYSVFLGRKPESIGEVREIGPAMQLPMIILALLCIVFGIFAQIPLRYLIGPAFQAEIPGVPEALDFGTAFWSPSLATLLILIGLGIGLIIYYTGKVKVRRTARVFAGGEMATSDVMRVPGTEFYDTVRFMGILSYFYGEAEKGLYDLYVLSDRGGSKVIGALRRLHNGVLSNYLSWCVVGIIVLLIVLMRM